MNGGSGKAQFYDLVQGRTIVDDFVRYAKGFSGQKVVVVRVARDKDGGDEWKINLGREIELALDQRSIEQNEFLDVILANDATTLKRQLQEEIVIDSSAPPPRDMSGVFLSYM